MSSPPAKKKEVPGDTRVRIKCPICDKALLRHTSMADHCFGKHQWSYKNNDPATPSELEKFQERKLADKRRKKTTSSKSGVVAGKAQECDLFSTLSDSVLASSDSNDSHAEMSDVEPAQEGPGPSVSRSDVEDKRGKQRWSPTPRPVSNPDNPCTRKKLELKIATGVKKAYAHAKGTQMAGPTLHLPF